MSIVRRTSEVKEINTYELNAKVNNFLKWYYQNVVGSSQIPIDKDRRVIKLKDFIEKVAVWYELRYPDYEINRLMPGSNQSLQDVNEEMFNNNPYMGSLFENFTAIKKIEWNEFYSTSVFINSLPSEEKYFFELPKYRNMVYLDGSRKHFHLSSDGYVTDAEYIYLCGKTEDFFTGKHIKEVVEFLKSNNVLSNRNELENAINEYEKRIYQREKMLNCIMYRIIERGGNRIGPRRAILFAEEFKRNIDIPMMYGIDTSDTGLGHFIVTYLNVGGNSKLTCIENYFRIQSRTQKKILITLEEIMNSYLKKEPYIVSFIESRKDSEQPKIHKKIR